VLQAVVDELLVDLVADEEQVVLLDQADDAPDLLGRVDRAGRVVRRAEQDGLVLGVIRASMASTGGRRKPFSTDSAGDDLQPGEGGVAVVVV